MEGEEVRLSDDDNLKHSGRPGEIRVRQNQFSTRASLSANPERRRIYLYRRQSQPDDHRSGLLPLQARHEGIAYSASLIPQTR